jgi:hypothetical protein
MSKSQIIGIRIACVLLGQAIGAVIFGTEMIWLLDWKSYIWCGFAGGCIGLLLTNQD